MSAEKVTAPVGDKQIIIETGKLAKQADGAVTVQMGDTIVLVAAVGAAKAKPGQEFFPLTVDYREKAAAAGKFPGKDRKSTRLNSSHTVISYAVFCLKKKKKKNSIRDSNKENK